MTKVLSPSAVLMGFDRGYVGVYSVHMKKEWNVPRIQYKKKPKEYAFSCFDNAVRFAAFNQRNQPDMTWFVVGGHNQYGVHYGFMSVEADGTETVENFDSPFLNGVEVKISVKEAVFIRNSFIEQGKTRISPCAEQPQANWMNRGSVRFIPDAEVALAPTIENGNIVV